MNTAATILGLHSSLWAMEKSAYVSLVAIVEQLLTADVLAAYGDGRKGEEKPPYEVTNGVASLRLAGPLMKEDHWLLSFLGGTSTAKFAASIAQAQSDPTVKAILLDVDSPGGRVDGTGDAAEAVAAASKVKPVHAHVNGCCCSATYWIASQARSIHSNSIAAIGSLGVRSGTADTSQLMERLGIKILPIATGEHKTTGMPGTPVTESQLAELQSQVDATGEIFKKAIAGGRKLKSDKVDSLFTGAVWIGKDAAAKGLTDGVASRATVMDALASYKPGRSAVHIAASAAGEKTMEWPKSWDEFRAIFARPDEAQSDTSTQAAAAQTAALTPNAAQMSASFVTPLRASAELEAERQKIAQELEASKKQREELEKAMQQMADNANRAVCESFMKQGFFTAAQLDENIKLRAQAPEVFDGLMKTRPRVALASDAISGDAAVDRVEQDAAADFTKQCKAYFRNHFGGTPAAGGNS